MMTEFLTRLHFLIFRKKPSEFDDEFRFHLEESIASKPCSYFKTITEDQQPAMFFPILQSPSSSTWLVVRSTREPQLGC
jgi:hypothetical protein